MAYFVPGCMGNYNFENIAHFARKRFLELHNISDLLSRTKIYREMEEVSLVSFLSLGDDGVAEVWMNCRYADTCEVSPYCFCQYLVRKMINESLKIDMLQAS